MSPHREQTDNRTIPQNTKVRTESYQGRSQNEDDPILSIYRMVRHLRLQGCTLVTLLILALGINANAGELPATSAETAYEHVVYLSGVIGERTAGSEAEERAALYILGKFESWGLDARLQTFRQPVWRARSAHIWTEGEKPLYLSAKSVVFGGTTPPEGVIGELVDLGTANEAQLADRDLAARIGLVKRDVYIEYPDYWLTDCVVPRGVAGLIFFSRPAGGKPTAYYNYKRALEEKTPPSVVITYEDAVELLRNNPSRVGIVVDAEVGWGQSRNVIADLKGHAKPAELVLITAHYDTAYTSPGATDNTGGVALVMELARAFAEASAPARTLRFIAWGGHETGLHGSEAYLRAHREQVENIVAVINFDAGHGTTLGTDSWVAAGPDEWIRFVKAVTDDSDLEPEWAVGTYYSDDTNFAALEVPTVNFDKGLSRIGRHTPKDNLKWTSPVGLQGGLLMSAMILEKISRDTSLTFPHQFPGDLIERVRNYAARYGWGIRPEANRPPRETRDQP